MLGSFIGDTYTHKNYKYDDGVSENNENSKRNDSRHKFVAIWMFFELHFLREFVMLLCLFVVQDRVPLISQSGIHQLHIFIFVLAVSHVLYSVVTTALGRAKVSF